MPFYIGVPSLITPVHCITQTEEPVNLIEQLLACTNDEELNNILQANQELIDPELLQVMETYATG